MCANSSDSLKILHKVIQVRVLVPHLLDYTSGIMLTICKAMSSIPNTKKKNVFNLFLCV